MTNSIVSVEIAGQRYPIRSSLDVAYVTELAAYVDEKMKSAAQAAPASDMLGLALLVALNLAVWGVAILTHPLSRLLPTESGDPPKIFSFLIPIFFLALAGLSTYLLSAGIGTPQDE